MKHTLLSISIMLIWVSLSAQTLTITTNSTPSICYNDGTLSIFASGGTAPYTDSILSGPSNPNLIYPIALSTGQNTFINLPHGTFTTVVHDAAGRSAIFTASVGGTYEFPTDSIYQNAFYGFGSQSGDTMICQVTSNTGLAPFEYAISAISANTGYGLFQSSNKFGGLCNGTYWIRVRDSCGNIFTNSYDLEYSLYLRNDCFNADSGTVSFTAYGGVAPYHFALYRNNYTIPLASNNTGLFSSFFVNNPADLFLCKVTDACGVSTSINFGRPTLSYITKCPFDSIISLAQIDNSAYTPLIVTCLNCTPQQTDTVYGPRALLFHNVHPNQDYYLSVRDRCNDHWIDTFNTNPVVFTYTAFPSCNQVQFSFITGGSLPPFGNGIIIPQSQIDSVIFYNGGVITENSTGLFPNPLNYIGGDSLYAYIRGGCTVKREDNLGLGLINSMPSPCATLHHNAQCGQSWDLIQNFKDINTESGTYYLVSSINDTIHQVSPGGDSGTYFHNVPPGTYTMVSDSGCTVPLIVDSVPPVYHSLASFVNCSGQAEITVTGFDTVGFLNNYVVGQRQWQRCTSAYFLISFYHNGTLVLGPDSVPYNTSSAIYATHSVFPADTGIYTYKIYYLTYTESYYGNTGTFDIINLNNHYDSICPIDSGSVYVTNRRIPFPYVNTSYKCNGVSASLPQLTIYGGSIPYTVQIPGVDTISMNTNTVTFPTDSSGIYSLIAYDNCGISRSFTFSIIDSCTGCGHVGVSVSLDTPMCPGSSATLTAIPQHPGGTYYWSPGGDTAQTIIVSLSSPALYTVRYTLYPCSVVSDSAFISVHSTPIGVLAYTADGLSYQFADSIISGTGSFTFIWNFGDGSPPDTSATVHHTYAASGAYTVSLIVSDSCGSDTLSHIVIVSTGINTIAAIKDVTIYPNPNHGTFTLSVSDMSSTGLTAEVTDILGRTVYKESIHTGKNTLQLDLTKGVYTVKVTDGNSRAVKILTIE